MSAVQAEVADNDRNVLFLHHKIGVGGPKTLGVKFLESFASQFQAALSAALHGRFHDGKLSQLGLEANQIIVATSADMCGPAPIGVLYSRSTTHKAPRR